MTLSIKSLCLLVLGLAACTAGAVEPTSPDTLGDDTHALVVSRQALARAVDYMRATPDLFPAKTLHQQRTLSREQRLAIWQTWQAFLDPLLALDSLGQTYNERYAQASGDAKPAAFRMGWAAYLAQYRYALDFIDIAERDPTLHVVLNEAVPELGLPAESYARLKFRFLNVLRGAEFARLDIVAKYYATPPDSPLNAGIDADRDAIWQAGKGRGPGETAQNALRIVQDTAFTTWFPVQKGVSTWMGDTKVWRVHQSLINAEQIHALPERLQPGDVLLIRHEWYLSNIGLPGFWPHAALYVGTPQERRAYFKDADVAAWLTSQGQSGDLESLIKARYPSAYAQNAAPAADAPATRVIEAISEGVSLTPVEHALDADSLVVLRPRLSQAAKARAIERAFHYTGRPYDFNFDFLTDATLVCSELVYKAYEPAGKLGGLQLPLSRVLGRQVVTPNDIARLFDEQYGTPAQQFDFVLFLDGHEAAAKATLADVATFRHSWQRPKWHVIIQDTPLARQ